jgi:hypothetical protein
VESLLGRQTVQSLDLEALETAVRRKVLSLAGSFLQRWLNQDASDYAGPHLPCTCRADARYAGRHKKRFQSVLGDLDLERAYYHCSHCGQGFCPRDRQLGLENTSLSPAITRMIAAVAALVSFQEGSELLNELAGVPVNAKQVQRTAESLGTEIAEDERHNLQPPDHLDLPKTLYLGMDGTGIPMRPKELAGRAGKQPDGSAKTREVKLCTLWSAEARDQNGIPVRDEGSVTYSAAIESAATSDPTQRAAFTERVLREATRRRFCQAGQRVVLGDGAPWIWNIAHELFPGCIQIVDRFHAKQHLSEMGKAIYGNTDPRATQWAKRRHSELDDGRFDAMLRAISRQIPTSDETRQCLHYFKTNRHRMRYPVFREQGLCTSTGVVEAGCKVAIGTRLKRAGMHWTLFGSNAIIALRCCRLSRRFQNFWERRSETRAA